MRLRLALKLARNLTILAFGILLLIAPMQARSQVSPAVSINPSTRIEHAARAQDPNDASSVRAVIEEVFNYPHAFPRLPSEIESSVKGKLTEAEVSFLKGDRKGVSEADVVRFFNQAANTLGAPEFAKTSPRQARALRMGLMAAMPTFIGRGTIHNGMQRGELISLTMSPVQAVHLFLMLTEAKFVAPDFQLSPADWDRDQHQKEMDKWQEARTRQASGSAPVTAQSASMAINNGSKYAEMMTSLSNGISSMNPSDAMKLLTDFLKVLGIQ